jgi:pyruvate kinase
LRVVAQATELEQRFDPGDVIATDATDASYVPFMQRAAAVLTVEGGLSSHAAVVCLSLGKPVIVGVRNALQLPDGETVTVDAAHGVVYRGRVQPG